MNNQSNRISRDNVAENLRDLRTRSHLTQEEVAEKLGVTRQAVAKWENGSTLPDIINCEALSGIYGVSLSDLVSYNTKQTGIPIPPKNKHIFGTATIGERGQIVLPKKARDIFGLKPGDTLVVLGDTDPQSAGIALVDAEAFMSMTNHVMDLILRGDDNA